MTTVHTIERPPQTPQEEAPPLLLLLHGFGSNEHDLMGLSPYLDKRLHIVSARAIFDVGFGFGWYYLYGVPGNLISDDATRAKSLEVLTKFIGDLPGRLGTNPRRLYLLGFSQGAVMSLNLALTVPHLVAGAIVASGYLDEKVLPRVQPDNLSHLNFLVMHGTEDDLITVEGGRGIRDYLETLPVQLTYCEYPIGHGIHPDALSLIPEWLSSRIDEDRPHADAQGA
jgi:phospholipase/carboxylesterase